MRSQSLATGSLMTASAFLMTSLLISAQPQIRDAATGDQLMQQYRQTSLNKPLEKLKPKIVEEGKELVDPTKHNQPADLIATSDFMTFMGMSTLIPKRSILHVPKDFKDRIRFEKGSNLVTWAQFYPANRGWIKTLEVTRAQAQGKEPFDEKVIENLNESTIVVVATYKGGPISVLPYVDPEAEVAEETEGEKTQ